MTVLIRAGHVLTMGAAGDLRDGAVLIDGEAIAAVGPYTELAAAHPDATVVGDEHGIVTPGLVNAHTHLSEGLITGRRVGRAVAHHAAEPDVGERVDRAQTRQRPQVHVAELVVDAHLHLAEVREEWVDADNRWGHSCIPHADAVGLLDDRRHITLDLSEVVESGRDAADRLVDAGGVPRAAQIRSTMAR
jgi:cytosine/adenosine deaminase-related metal-dependent hydrolase